MIKLYNITSLEQINGHNHQRGYHTMKNTEFFIVATRFVAFTVFQVINTLLPEEISVGQFTQLKSEKIQGYIDMLKGNFNNFNFYRMLRFDILL